MYLTANPIGWGVHRPSRTEDKLWEAVEEAVIAGWTPEQFRRECAEAWRHALQNDMDDTMKQWETK